MMQEKAMVSDALNSINADLKALADMISQTENQELRSTLQQMRNEAEKSQYELYNIAKNLNYYQPAQKASQDEINRIKNTFSQSSGMSGSSSGMSGGDSGMSGGGSGMGGSSSGMSGSSSGMSGMTSGMGGSSGMSGSSSGMSRKNSGMGGSSGTSGSSGMNISSGNGANI